MKFRLHLFVIYLCLVLCGVSTLIFVYADTEDVGVSVGATVGGGGSGGGSGDVSSPSISDVVSVPDNTSATVSWSALDNVSVSSCSFVYGTSVSYGLSESVSGTYAVSLVGLSAATQYFFQISCSDAAGNTGTQNGSFVTTSGGVVTVTVLSTSTSQTSATVLWSASVAAPKSIVGCTLGYGIGNYSMSGVVSGMYQSTISSLIPNTSYQCRITCTDNLGGMGTAECPWNTSADTTPPPDVSSFTAVGASAQNILSWVYNASVSDFLLYRIEWALGGCPARGAGTLVSEITNSTQLNTTHMGLQNGTTYYYRLSVYDTSGNASAGVCVSAAPQMVAAVCGNGVIDGGEQCDDGNSINTDSCLNTCVSATCGDDVVWAGIEQCDGSDLNGATCVSRGYDGGSLTCGNTCMFVNSACTVAPVTCGNGVVNPGETCDDGNNNPNDSCTNLCQPATCGDNVIRVGTEQCDGSDFGGVSCGSLGYVGGSLSCSNLCTRDVSSCVGDVSVVDGNPEECTNAFDDDLDGLIDCDDSDCSTHSVCTGVFACADGLDNDGDGFIDLQDAGCASTNDTDEYNAPEVSVPSNERVSNVRYWIAERTIPVTPIRGVIKSLTGDQLTVGIAESELYMVTPSTTLTLVLSGVRYSFVRGADGVYRADVVFPSVGTYDAVVEIFYTEGVIDIFTFRIESAPYGVVFGEGDERLSDASVVLLDQDGNIFDITVFRQENPYITGNSGVYGFVVPNGQYILLVSKDGYQERKTYSFRVDDHVVNRSITVLKLPETITEAIAFSAAVSVQQIQDAILKINDVADSPVVEEVTSDVVAPTLATVTTISIVPSLLSIIVPLLRFLFLQPLLIVGRRKRQAWGVVYNSLNKLPIDLATIRLIDKKTGHVVQSRVTDSKGRYLFMVEQGEYAIEVFKQGFVFPSKLLAHVREDGAFLDVYHGEVVVVQDEETHITPNIPVDPADTKEKSIRRIIAEKWFRRVQNTVSIVGIIGAAISVYIFPSAITIALLGLHVVLYLVFVQYVKPKKPKGWGLVYEHETTQPVGRAVARLFSKQFDKLVATQVTDSKGRYSFLVGPNDYYVTFEKEGYAPEKTDSVVIKEEAGLVVQDVALKKGVVTLPKQNNEHIDTSQQENKNPLK